MNTLPLLAINSLSCIRQGRVLFAAISAAIGQGELLLVTGSNGSGKSTLLRTLAGISSPVSGHILWQQQSIHDCLDVYHQQLHYIGHTLGVKSALTPRENLSLIQTMASHAVAVESILSSWQLTTCQDIPVKELSAGQKRRVALAKLSLIPKSLWILDEPLTALDAASSALFTACLSSHLQMGGLAILSSHQPIPFTTPPARIVSLELC